MKGERNGECKRTACHNTPAIGYHFANQAWYCRECSHTINTMNKWDAVRLYNLTFIIALPGEVSLDDHATLEKFGYDLPEGLTDSE